MAPAASASSISLVNNPLPPTSASGRSWMRSPLVRITSSAIRRGRRPSALASVSRPMRAWVSASGLPRVPSRRMMPVDCATVPRKAGRYGNKDPMLVLGIETTCDETVATVVEREGDGPGKILSNIVLSQISEHAPFGGVVPEIAARAHVEALDRVIAKALMEAGKTLAEIDGIAPPARPRVIGRRVVGLTAPHAVLL